MHLKNGIVYNITVTERKGSCHGGQLHCYRGQGFLSRRTAVLLQRTRILVTEEVPLVVEDRVCFFVYRLVLDAKPDRGMK